MKTCATIVSLLALGTTGVAGFGYGGYRLFRPASVVLTPTYRKQVAILKKAASSGLSSPRYELTDNDDKFQVAIDVPGVSMDDIVVNLEDDGKVLTIAGERKSSTDRYQFNSKFSQSFTVDPAVDVDKFTASLQNGVLIVAAPKDMKRLEANIRQIPITSVTGETSIEAPAELEETSKEQALEDAAVLSEEDSEDAAKKPNDDSKDDSSHESPEESSA